MWSDARHKHFVKYKKVLRILVQALKAVEKVKSRLLVLNREALIHLKVKILNKKTIQPKNLGVNPFSIKNQNYKIKIKKKVIQYQKIHIAIKKKAKMKL